MKHEYAYEEKDTRRPPEIEVRAYEQDSDVYHDDLWG
jgi:hypothetical protein